MDLKYLSIVALAACRPVTHETRVLLSAASECGCPCADAGVDAPAPDAAPDAPSGPAPIDLATAWTRIIITPSSGATGVLRGADGVARDDEGCWWTAWEEGGAVTRACGSGATWVTETVATGLVGGEDAKPGDFDGDGMIDGAVAIDATAGGVYVAFRDPALVVKLASSAGHGHLQQLAVGDVDADGDPDIAMGTRVGTPAVVAWLVNPGGASARNGLAWAYREVSLAGWVMSLIPLDVNGDSRLDLVVSDRAAYKDAGGVTRWDLYGARWMEQLPDGTWMAHAISQPAGSCSPYTSPTCLKTPGDEMMLSIVAVDVGGTPDWLVADGQSAGSQPSSRISLHMLGAGTHEFVSPVANVGHYQHAVIADLDLDGDPDLAVSTWKGNAYPVSPADAGKSGVYWLRNDGATWSRGEVSGSEGGKFDNLALSGRCIVTSEQLDPAGGLGVLAYCPPGEALP